MTTLGERATIAPLPRPKLTRQRKVGLLFGALVVALGLLVITSAGSGQYGIAWSDVVGSVVHRLSGPLSLGRPVPDRFAESALWQIRMPRIVLSVIVGAVLATAGTVMQGIFGNPLAEPGVVGVSSGAAVGAAAVIAGGVTVFGEFTIAAGAFVTGLGATLLVYALSRANGRTEIVTVLLTGIAVNAVSGAGLALFTFLGNQQQREQIVFWQLGSLNGARWIYVVTVLPLAVAGLIGAFVLGPRLDLLALGDRPARHLGVDVERVRLFAIVCVAGMVAAAVAFCGVIAFVGLVVPHLIRLLVGPGHRVLLPASALGGAVLLSAADLVARTAVAYADLPIGMLTALVGGPFFFWLLRRARARSGGWV